MFRQSNQYAAPVLEPLLRAGFSQRPDVPAEKPGILPHTGSIYAILKIRSVYVRGPKGKNTENGGPAACSPKFDNFGP